MFGCVEPVTGIVIAKRANNGNSKTFKNFLKKVIHQYKGKKVIMILDNVRYHHAKSLRKFLENHKNQIELFFLPAYSPDFNPMERVWWYMRKKITHNRYVVTMEERKKLFWQMFSHFSEENDTCRRLCNLCVNYY